MNILGVETTCDETSLALVKDGKTVIYEATVSQILKHREFGGVVPDLGAREHLANLQAIGDEFMKQIAGHEINAVAVAAKVGLPPAVQVGEAYAAGLAKSLKVPLIPINHVIAHVWGIWIDEAFDTKPQFPFLGLIVSGNHTQLVQFDSPTSFDILGETFDDAAGEAFDKVARMLKLPYPGGPEIEKNALTGDEKSIAFPIPLKNDDSLNFSFSGLKTAVRNYVAENESKYKEETRKFFVADVCASFQLTAFTHIANKVLLALKETKLQELVIGGGVACNQRMTDILFKNISPKFQVEMYVPSRKLCTDNGSLIAGYAFNLL